MSRFAGPLACGLASFCRWPRQAAPAPPWINSTATAFTVTSRVISSRPIKLCRPLHFREARILVSTTIAAWLVYVWGASPTRCSISNAAREARNKRERSLLRYQPGLGAHPRARADALERSRSQARLLAQQDLQRRRYEGGLRTHSHCRARRTDEAYSGVGGEKSVPRPPLRPWWPTTILFRRTCPRAKHLRLRRRNRLPRTKPRLTCPLTRQPLPMNPPPIYRPTSPRATCPPMNRRPNCRG